MARLGIGIVAVVIAVSAAIALADGVQKNNYVSAVEIEQDSTGLGTESPRRLAVPCPEGTFIIGGGADIDGNTSNVSLRSSEPFGNTGWEAAAWAPKKKAEEWSLSVHAICADTGSPGPLPPEEEPEDGPPTAL